ncbi:hypothetical protein CHLNCDRAFT_142157 [Chlorella variabilis]|uniref:Uncharacterized protein n=1 Tax=Chlorella variabilis TaxID=554065 RepID=E1Z7W9_CHLVA|nr:hypothetical protein CHLNCDRAFT_142157 [Chlorella variabilis]EFN57993.1 hypothetical protein CHLNCDRAFT_142157 [Chlorella variabilis]|eukprot:XP_005850095.1 hypothetical protein CHLNCDRAFT_142157 [Chlorella variabilis]
MLMRLGGAALVVRQGGLRCTLLHNLLGSGQWEVLVMNVLIGMGPGGAPVSLSLLQQDPPDMAAGGAAVGGNGSAAAAAEAFSGSVGGSPKGKALLADWASAVQKFWQLVPPSEAISPQANKAADEAAAAGAVGCVAVAATA